MIMNKLSKLLMLLAVIAMLVGCLAACKPENTEGGEGGSDNGGSENGGSENGGSENGGEQGGNEGGEEEPQFVDYASQLKFDENSGKKWVYATVKSYIDGDTTHFFVNDPDLPDGYVKARYLGINTPESTGIVEPWGKKASNYTKTQLQKAESITNGIIIESDTDSWDLDSTGERYLLWIWYKTSENAEYRNLNLEILQQGLAFGSNTTSNTYSEYTTAALYQATTLKLYVFNKKVKDPDYYYGSAVNLTLKELKTAEKVWSEQDNRVKNKYEGMLVKFEAVIAKKSGYTLFVEEYDAQNDMYFGMQIYAGFGCPIMERLAVGNRVSFVGRLMYYENGGYYQVSDLQYDILFPDWEGGCCVIDTGVEPSYREGNVGTLTGGKINIESYVEREDENGEMVEELQSVEFDYGELSLHSTISFSTLTVKSVYTTESTTDSNGALSITCTDASGKTIVIRTATKLIREDNTIVVEDDFPVGTVISARGIVDVFNGKYQVEVTNIDDLVIKN